MTEPTTEAGREMLATLRRKLDYDNLGDYEADILAIEAEARQSTLDDFRSALEIIAEPSQPLPTESQAAIIVNARNLARVALRMHPPGRCAACGLATATHKPDPDRPAGSREWRGCPEIDR